MQEYTDKDGLVSAIRQSAHEFFVEFEGIEDEDKNMRFKEVYKTPHEMLAHLLGWINLMRKWDQDETEGKEAVLPAPGHEWKNMNKLYQSIYQYYQSASLADLHRALRSALDSYIEWLDGFSDEELFQPGGRKWASSMATDWPIAKWIEINMVASFKAFQKQARTWKEFRTGESHFRCVS